MLTQRLISYFFPVPYEAKPQYVEIGNPCNIHSDCIIKGNICNQVEKKCEYRAATFIPPTTYCLEQIGKLW